MSCAMLPLWTALDERDHGTALHTARTAGVAREMGQALALDPDQLEHLHIAATLHDIGKIGIPDSILLKLDDLVPEEWKVMRSHSERGARILSAHDTGIGKHIHKDVIETVLYHHERFDGSGYPEGLKGNNIPILARILFLADAYDAMTSPRPYRKALSHDRALALLSDEDSRQADPRILDVFQRVITISRYRAH
ncbi:MAG: HD-GYP domain-containing protein [Acidiferrobacter sp.]